MSSNKPESLKGKNAIVTGGSRGIGKGIANELASRGANILITYQSAKAQAEEVVSELELEHGVTAIAIAADGHDLSAPQTIVQAAVDKWGQIDIIVKNAGAREDYDFEDMTHETFKRQITAICRVAIRAMDMQVVLPIQPVKVELKVPGPVNTELWARSIKNPEVLKAWEPTIQNTSAAPRVGEVDDIAQAVAFLCEEGSRWVTGSVISVSGGLYFNQTITAT
ncbi:hypothetical protein N7478_010797 [Penicillium angulare]|uniref:uncharacterized protein n=1 Tax=Penicillium angulare TaxID=116970 RepID=UPI00253F8473|nr:uncharacterized protein N7478_010797 [Penicillium angulare]KAJ5263192.1 hypothetical protein N7478_010797 [Penicillium angulare]